MFKSLKNYLRRRREQKLRKWCAKMVPENEPDIHFVANAEWLYYWITIGKLR